MQPLLDWLYGLPAGTLYTVLAMAAAIENIIPPFPSDVTVAFGSFVAAQGHQATMLWVFAATWAGNVLGALLVFALGRRYGAERLERRLAGKHAESRDATLRRLFQRYGLAAVFVSRFIPGVRAIVPAFAGALRLAPLKFGAMVAAASAIWYGLITVVAFRVGADWTTLRGTIARYGTILAIAATVILVLGIAVWWFVRKSRPS